MCMLSVVLNYGITQMPQLPQWSPAMIENFLKITETVKIMDIETQQPDCEDPDKAEFLKKLEAMRNDLASGQTEHELLVERLETLSLHLLERLDGACRRLEDQLNEIA